MIALRPCPHREILPGPLATAEDLATWAAELALTPCPACAAPPPPEPPPLPDLPPDVAAVLRVDGRAGALRAQAYLDATGLPAELLPAVADALAHQPGTGPYWRRWWATWRGGVLLDLLPAQ